MWPRIRSTCGGSGAAGSRGNGGRNGKKGGSGSVRAQQAPDNNAIAALRRAANINKAATDDDSSVGSASMDMSDGKLKELDEEAFVEFLKKHGIAV